MRDQCPDTVPGELTLALDALFLAGRIVLSRAGLDNDVDGNEEVALVLALNGLTVSGALIVPSRC